MSEVLDRLSSALASRYRVERELGRGGMATVFRAHDLRHDRDVAVKVIFPDLAAMLGGQRFLAEITTTAKLQHPHILPLLDSGEAEGLLYYVMPLIDGESLRGRLDRERQLPLDEAIRITTEVAAALDYSHRHGVIHRDIKPENILLHDGSALVADFGIALALSAAGGERLTATGLSLGTPQYMSPEQATGERSVDGRTDVYSLGCVLYEMLTGAPPFVGASAQAIIAQLITTSPKPVSATRPTVPAHIDAAIDRALQKLPADRFRSPADFAAALSGTTAADVGKTPRRLVGRRATAWRLPAVAAGCLLVGAVAGVLIARARDVPAASGPTVRLATPVARIRAAFGGLAMSSDGRFAVIVGGEDSRLWIRRVDSFDLQPIAGTTGAQLPFLSPDNQWVGFTAAGRLRKVRIDGGPVVDIAPATWGNATWGPDGTIVFTPTSSSGLWQTTADGAAPRVITAPDTTHGEFSHWWPQFLPDGHTLIFTDYRTPYSKSRIEAIDLRTKRRTVLVEDAMGAIYLRTGHLLFSRGTPTVFAVAFDANQLRVQGDPKPVLEDVESSAAQGRVSVAVSHNGTLAYLMQSQWSPQRTLVWFDRTGKETALLTKPGYYTSPRVSPDGRRVAFATIDEGRDIDLYDPSRALTIPVTSNDGADFDPVWTPDGDRLIYLSERGAFDLYWRKADLSAPEEPLVVDHFDKFPTDVSRDGKWLVYTEWAASRDIHFRSLPDSQKPAAPVFPNTSRNEELATFSPDTRWVAYTSDESGRQEIYVRPFPNLNARRIQVSTNGGTEAHWTRGGREIVFRQGDTMLSAAFDPATGTLSAPMILFRSPTISEGYRNSYDVAPDGSRFLLAKPMLTVDRPTVNIVINWFPELRAKLAR